MVHRSTAVAASLFSLAAPCLGQTSILISHAPPEVGSQFGTAIAGIPDLDGDGMPDVVVGGFYEAFGSNANAGRVHIYSGATGAWRRTINPPTTQPLGTFGWNVLGIPDVTGDGRGDIVVSGMWEDDGSALACGRAYLFSGATGQWVRGWFSPYKQSMGAFGWAIGKTPDADGDGVTDIIISAAGETSFGGIVNAGRVYLYSGATGGLLRWFSSPNPTAYGNFGFAVAGVPDVNGDGRSDIIIGAPNENPGSSPSQCGRVYVYSGATGALLRVLGSPYPQVSGQFGVSVAGLRDINGDNLGDIVVGAGLETPPFSPSRSGAVHIYSGATGFGIRHLTSPHPSINGSFGLTVAAGQDMNGDGRPELIVAAPRETAGVAECGRVYVFAPSNGALLRTVNSPTPVFQGQFGGWVAGIGDTNGDGRGDVLIGAPAETGTPGVTRSGKGYIVR